MNKKDLQSDVKWRLEDLFPNNAEWESLYKKTKGEIGQMAAFEGTLQNEGQLKKALDTYFALVRQSEKLFVYARMRRDEDNGVALYQGMVDRAFSLNVALDTQTAYLVPEILTLDETPLRKAFLGQLSLYKRHLTDILRQKAHVLTAPEERLMALCGEMTETPDQVFTMLHDADMRFPVIKGEEGEKVEITHGKYLSLLQSHDRRVRKSTYEGLYQTYEKNINTLASLLAGSVKVDAFKAKVRKYPSALEASLDGDFVTPEIYDTLIKTVEEGLPDMTQYLKLRKKLLKVPILRPYDLYVPLMGEKEEKIPYNKAKEIVREAVAVLGKEYQAILDKAFEGGWIDVYESRGKTSGAYAWGVYGTHPFVLLNYQDQAESVSTLAHEMGHALHSYLSNENQSYVDAGYRIFVAEVASTVNELLLYHYWLKNCTDNKRRLSLLNHYLEQIRTTVFRQTLFAEFEKRIHAAYEEGEALTPEKLSDIYDELNGKYYGKVLKRDNYLKYEWSRIPHFYSAFYVYKYATGFSAAVDISTRLLKGEPGAKESYLNFLKSGGSEDPIILLQRAGVDLTKPHPVRACMKSFDETLNEFEALLRSESLQ